MKRIYAPEPWIFLFFGGFHLHRIWGLLDRRAYADFWLGVMRQRNWFYFLLMGLLAVLCILGIKIFLENLHHNYWWRRIYVFGGAYVLFDLSAIAIGWYFWHELIMKMFDTTSPWWNPLWLMFILIGGAAFALGIKLLIDRHQQKTSI